uniref:Uncharacterized protein n=1 Tax=Eutreptiella gymnastica TaxID=73025 RepID=A0A7S4GJD4_9EUGL
METLMKANQVACRSFHGTTCNEHSEGQSACNATIAVREGMKIANHPIPKSGSMERWPITQSELSSVTKFLKKLWYVVSQRANLCCAIDNSLHRTNAVHATKASIEERRSMKVKNERGTDD